MGGLIVIGGLGASSRNLNDIVESPRKIYLRAFVNHAKTLLTNLAANPSIRTGRFANVVLVAMVQDPNDLSSHSIGIPALDDVVTAAAALSPPMQVIPGMRLMEHFGSLTWGAPPTLHTIPDPDVEMPYWFDLSWWTSHATGLENIAAYRSDTRVALDVEPYGLAQGNDGFRYPQSDGYAAWGYTLDDLTTAMKPFTDAVARLSVAPCLHPAHADSDAHYLIVQAGGGPQNSEHWYEGISFYFADFKRSSPNDDFMTNLEQFHRQDISGVLARYPNSKQRPGAFDDALRDHCQEWFENLEVYNASPWVFIQTTADVGVIGTTAWLDSSNLNALNNAVYSFYIGGLSHGGDCRASPSLVAAPNRMLLEAWQASDASGGTETLYHGLTRRADGYHLDIPSGGTMAGVCMHAYDGANSPYSVLPYPTASVWTMKLPTITISADAAADVPIVGGCQTNLATWMLVWVQSTNKIVLRVNIAGSFVDTDIATGGTYIGVPLKLMVGRKSNTEWVAKLNSGTPVRATLGGTSGTTAGAIYFGMGITGTSTPATRFFSHDANGIGLHLHSGTAWTIWHTALTDGDMSTIYTGSGRWGTEFPMGYVV